MTDSLEIWHDRKIWLKTNFGFHYSGHIIGFCANFVTISDKNNNSVTLNKSVIERIVDFREAR